MVDKLRVAVLGPGNIGIDLMIKLLRSKTLDMVMMAGVDTSSYGLKLAAEKGITASLEGVQGIVKSKNIDIVFDATGARPHLIHEPLLKEAGIFAIDLTPAAVGPYIVPAVNLAERLLDRSVQNVNMVTCGGQATVPVVHAISRVTPVDYAEIVATISSRSAGPGTRQNIDEFTETTRDALIKVGGAKQGKAIIILNPAEPPIMMRNTIYARCDSSCIDEIKASILSMVKTVQRYVPGYHLKVEPYADGERVVCVVEVEGAGDYLPNYSGNLDIITSAAVAVAEEYAEYTRKGKMA